MTLSEMATDAYGLYEGLPISMRDELSKTYGRTVGMLSLVDSGLVIPTEEARGRIESFRRVLDRANAAI